MTNYFLRVNENSNLQDNSSTSSEPLDTTENAFAKINYLPIYYQNIKSIPAKSDLRSKIKYSVYKTLCFTETWLNKDHEDESYFPEEFAVYRRDRTTNGGGVAILVHENFKSIQIDQTYESDCESVCVKIELEPVPLVIYVAYVNNPRKPGALMKHYDRIRKIMLTESESRMAVMADFNLHQITWNLDDTDTFYLPQNITSHAESEYFKLASDFLQQMQGLPLYQLSNVKNLASNVLDLIFVNATGDMQCCNAPVALTKTTKTDPFHPPLEIQFEYHISKSPCSASSNETIEVLAYKKGDYVNMSRQLDELNFAQMFDQMDIESAFDCFYDLMNRLITENV